MIYFDNAATSWPKPLETKKEIKNVMENFGANPGRGAYSFAKDTSDYMEGARAEIADFLGIKTGEPFDIYRWKYRKCKCNNEIFIKTGRSSYIYFIGA